MKIHTIILEVGENKSTASYIEIPVNSKKSKKIEECLTKGSDYEQFLKK